MYTIIGGDGREYGPVSAVQVRQWIAAGRANGQTRAKAFGTEEWKQIQDFEEFTAPPPVGRPDSGPSPLGEATNERAAEVALHPGAFHSAEPDPATFDPIECFSRSWALLRQNFWVFVGLSTLVIVVMFAPASGVRAVFPYTPDPAHIGGYFVTVNFWSGIWISFLLTQPLSAGCLYYFLKKARGEEAVLADLFAGFTRAYLPLVAAIIVASCFETIGCLFLILPGIYLAVAYSLAKITVVDQKVGFWAGLEISRRAVTQRWWSVLLLALLSALIIIVGIIVLGVGVLVAFPLVIGAWTYAYLDLVPGSHRAAHPVVSDEPTQPAV